MEPIISGGRSGLTQPRKEVYLAMNANLTVSAKLWKTIGKTMILTIWCRENLRFPNAMTLYKRKIPWQKRKKPNKLLETKHFWQGRVHSQPGQEWRKRLAKKEDTNFIVSRWNDLIARHVICNTSSTLRWRNDLALARQINCQNRVLGISCKIIIF